MQAYLLFVEIYYLNTYNCQFLFAIKDGTLRQFSLERDELNMIESLPLGQDVTSLSFNQTYAKLAIGNSKVLSTLNFILICYVDMKIHVCFFNFTFMIINIKICYI